MLKLLIIALMVWLGFSLFKKLKKAPHNAQKPIANKMVACHVCDMRIPENEAIIRNGHVYCSQAHLNQGKSS